MSFGLSLLVCTLALDPTAASRESPRVLNTIDYHVRSTDPLVRAWIKNGAAESQTLSGLLAELAASDVIVHVVLVNRIAGGANGQLYFVTATPTARYLRAEITRVGGRADTIALIAHELQHAAEVAASARVRDSLSLSSLYLGMSEPRRDSGHYDSAAARVTEDIVRREVVSHRTQPDEELQLTAQLRPSTHLR